MDNLNFNDGLTVSDTNDDTLKLIKAQYKRICYSKISLLIQR